MNNKNTDQPFLFPNPPTFNMKTKNHQNQNQLALYKATQFENAKLNLLSQQLR